MLVPATPDDLKLAGKITVAPNSETASVKTVQIKVIIKILRHAKFWKNNKLITI